MKMQTTEQVQESSNVEGEIKEFDFTKTVIYPSGARDTKIKLAFLKWDYDLDLMSDKCDVKVTHNLNFPLNGHRKAISNKRYRSFIAKEDKKGFDGKTFAKKGDTIFAYDSDKVRTCVLATKMVNSKNMGESKFRRSVELFIPCYIFSIDAVNKETGKREVKEVNAICLVGFAVGDLYSRTVKGVGTSILNSFSDDPEENSLKNNFFEYTATGLTPKKEIKGKDLELVDGLRKSVETWLDDSENQKLFPVSYQVLEQALEDGSYDLETGNKSFGGSNNTKFTPKTSDVKEEEDDEVPF